LDITAVDPEEGVTYRAGLRFQELCLPIWEELARGAHAPPHRSATDPDRDASRRRSFGSR
jgi:hypothetical protein